IRKMKYSFAIKIEDVWTCVKPSGSEKPYEYDTEGEAYKMGNMCYGVNYIPFRIVKH
ncbi:unnamed protein product, partial [marine sediment metagenome]